MRVGVVSVILAMAAIAPPLFSHAAMAAPPTLNGAYDFNYVQNCQATINTSSKGGVVTGLTANSGGNTSVTLGVATFNSTRNTFSLKGYQESGDLVMLNGAAGTKVMREEHFNFKLTFSTTANTFTFTPTTGPRTPINLNAIYLAVDPTTFVAAYVEFLGIVTTLDPNTTCYAHGTAILQSE